jgi:hypothetical protein
MIADNNAGDITMTAIEDAGMMSGGHSLPDAMALEQRA